MDQNKTISRASLCIFLVFIFEGFFTSFAHADDPLPQVIISEIAWMGTENSPNDEWIELQNLDSETVSLENWTLEAEDGTPTIALSGEISSESYFLLERTDDDSVPDINADLIYTGGLGNTGEKLVLKNSSGAEIFVLDNASSWEAGDNDTKLTMSRTGSGTWLNSNQAGGTPRADNFPTSNPDPETGSGSELIPPSDFTATPADSEITLSWTFPASASGVLLLQGTGSLSTFPQDGSGYTFSDWLETGQVVYIGSGSTFTASALANDQEYFFALLSFDSDLNYSEPQTCSATPFVAPPPPDTTPPSEVTNLQIESQSDSLHLSWENPSDPDFVSVRILRSQIDFPTDCTSGDLVFSDNSGASFLDQDLESGQSYFYRICTYDAVPNFSEGMTISGIPFATPDVIFSEIAWAGSQKSNADEWLELRNLTDTDISLSGWQIWDEVKNEAIITFPESTQVSSGSYFLLANYIDTADNSTLAIPPDFVENDLSLSNSALGLSLRNSSGTVIDRAGSDNDPPAGRSTPYKVAMQRTFPLQPGSENSSWEDAKVSFGFDPGASDLGTPGSKNLNSDSLAPATPTLQVIQTSSGALLEFAPTFDDGQCGQPASHLHIYSSVSPLTPENLPTASLLATISDQSQSHFVASATLEIYFTLQAEDEAGNLSPLSESIPLIQDETAPNLAFSPDPTETVFDLRSLPLTVTITANDPHALITCSESGSQTTFSGSGQLILIQDTFLTCSTRDLADNESSPENYTFEFLDLTDQVYLSEIMPNPEGNDTENEWIELVNISSHQISLSGWQLRDDARTYTFPASAKIGSGSYLFLPRVTSNLSLQNSKEETISLYYGDESLSHSLSRLASAPSGHSLAFNLDTLEWVWTSTPTPAARNIFTFSSAQNERITGSSGGRGSSSYPTFSSAPTSSELTLRITALSFRDSEHDWIEFLCLDCDPAGTSLEGWSVWDDSELFTFPLDLKVKANETFRLEFKSEAASDFTARILRSADSGLTATDEQLTLKDPQGIISDAVCWANQDGKWSRGEAEDVSELITFGAWKSASGLDFDESVCFDSSSLKSNQPLQRQDSQIDTNSLSDWIAGTISSPETKNEQGESEDIKEDESSESTLDLDFSGLKLSEILPNPSSSDTENEWLELVNLGTEPLPLSEVVLQTGNQKKKIAADITLNPHSYLVLRRGSDFSFSIKNKAGELALLDPRGNLLDATSWTDSPEDQSWSRFDDSWAWTDALSPSLENVLSQPKKPLPKMDSDYTDSDGDLIPDSFERALGSDPDTPEQSQTTFSAYLSSLQEQVELISDLASSSEKFPKLSGSAPPGSQVHLILHSKIVHATVIADANGLWEYAPEYELESGSHTVFVAVEDQNGACTPYQKVANFSLPEKYIPPVFPLSVRIYELFPNPEGADSTREWLELENFSNEEISLSDWTLSDSKQTFTFPNTTKIHAHSFLTINSLQLPFSLKNSNPQLLLHNPAGKLVSELVYKGEVKDDYSLIWNEDTQKYLPTLHPTPSSPNLLQLKNSAENPLPASLSTLDSLASGTWIRTIAHVLIPSHQLGRDTLWLQTNNQIIRLQSENLTDFPEGQPLLILGKVSHTQDFPTQILATASDSWILPLPSNFAPEATPQAVSVPLTLANSFQFLTLSGIVASQDRHFVTLENGSRISFWYLDHPPLLQAGDQVQASGLVIPHPEQGLLLTPWRADQVTAQLAGTDLLDLPSQLPPSKDSPLPLFGGILASLGASAFLHRHLKCRCFPEKAS